MTEIAGLQVPPAYEPKLVILYNSAVEALSNMIPMSPSLGNEFVNSIYIIIFISVLDIAKAYENGSDDHQDFVQNVALFLTSFLCEHLTVCCHTNYQHT